jgi:hypothetical protein
MSELIDFANAVKDMNLGDVFSVGTPFPPLSAEPLEWSCIAVKERDGLPVKTFVLHWLGVLIDSRELIVNTDGSVRCKGV